MIDTIYHQQWKYSFLIGIHHQFFLPVSYFLTQLPRCDIAFYFPSSETRNAYLTQLCLKCSPQSAAGGIVFNEKNQILMIRRNGIWDLPKGKMELDERVEETAVREVEEETGVTVNEILRKWNTTVHLYFVNRNLIWKETHWYVMRAQSNKPLKPQRTEGVEYVTWIPIEEIPALFPIYRLIKDLLLPLIQSRTHWVLPQ